MKALSECPRQGLPVDLHVASASVVNGHAVYTCALHSTATGRSWTVAYRYSELRAFKSTVEEVLTCDSPKCSGSCQAIRDYMNACFPKKRVLFSTSQRVLKSRQQKLENVLLHLLRCVLLPGSAMKCAVARRVLPLHLFEFLGVQNALDRRSLLQVYVDDYQRTLRHGSFFSWSSLASSSPSFSPPPCSQPRKAVEGTVAVTAERTVVATADASCCQCVICLEDVDAIAVTGVEEGDGGDGDDHHHYHNRHHSRQNFRDPGDIVASSSSSCRTSCLSDEMSAAESSRSSLSSLCAEATSGELSEATATATATTTTFVTPSAAVALPCGHVFHRECVFEWLLFELHCPLCRSRVVSAAVTSFCRAKNRVQWWIGEFEDDRLRQSSFA